jgi:hypothetical protein
MSRPTVWACAACGKTAPSRDELRDASCWLHGVEVYTDSLKYDLETGRVIRARAVMRAIP